jgi:hypothetical protein
MRRRITMVGKILKEGKSKGGVIISRGIINYPDNLPDMPGKLTT